MVGTIITSATNKLVLNASRSVHIHNTPRIPPFVQPEGRDCVRPSDGVGGQTKRLNEAEESVEEEHEEEDHEIAK